MHGKLDQLKAARARRGRVYNSVEEFMAERAMIIDLAMARGQLVQVSGVTFFIHTSLEQCIIMKIWQLG